jgi:hypothetical protein
MCTRTEGICTPVVSRVCEHTVCCWTSVSGLVVLTPLTAIWERCRYRYGAGPNSHAARDRAMTNLEDGERPLPPSPRCGISIQQCKRGFARPRRPFPLLPPKTLLLPACPLSSCRPACLPHFCPALPATWSWPLTIGSWDTPRACTSRQQHTLQTPIRRLNTK